MHIAKQVFGIDIIIEGGIHLLMRRPQNASSTRGVSGIDVDWQWDSNRNGNIELDEATKYPTVIRNLLGERVIIVASGAHSEYIGDLEVWFDDYGNVIGWDGDSIEVSNLYCVLCCVVYFIEFD